MPTEFLGKFDVVNLRPFMFLVKNNDPSSILAKMVRMLKPGGWIQWAEADLLTSQMVKIPSETTSIATEMLQEKLVPTDPRFTRGTWVPELHQYFERVGSQHVQVDDRSLPHKYISFHQENLMILYEEIIGKVPESDFRSELTDPLGRAKLEARAGVGYNASRLMTVGQKPVKLA